jgi:hypothetical protein
MLVEKQWKGRPQGVKCIAEDCDYKESPAPAEDKVEHPDNLGEEALVP